MHLQAAVLVVFFGLAMEEAGAAEMVCKQENADANAIKASLVAMLQSKDILSVEIDPPLPVVLTGITLGAYTFSVMCNDEGDVLRYSTLDNVPMTLDFHPKGAAAETKCQATFTVEIHVRYSKPASKEAYVHQFKFVKDTPSACKAALQTKKSGSLGPKTTGKFEKALEAYYQSHPKL